MDISNKRRSSSVINKKPKSEFSGKTIPIKSKDVELQLNGKLISLSKRPGGFSGRNSARSGLISDSDRRRPVSAIPSLHLHRKANLGSVTDWKRPQSADHPFPANNTSHPTTKERNFYFPQANSDWKELDRANLFSLKKPLSLSSLTDESDNSYHVTTPRVKSSGKGNLNASLKLNLQSQKIENNDYYSDFGATYTLPDMLERTWTEEELIRYCDEIEDFDSDENLQSDSSMGEKILAMASQANISGLKHINSSRHEANTNLTRSYESLHASRLKLAEKETDLLLEQLVAREQGSSNFENNHLILDFNRSGHSKELHNEPTVSSYTSNGADIFADQRNESYIDHSGDRIRDALSRVPTEYNRSNSDEIQTMKPELSFNKDHGLLERNLKETTLNEYSFATRLPTGSPDVVSLLNEPIPLNSAHRARAVSARSRSLDRNISIKYEPPMTSRSLNFESDRRPKNYSPRIISQSRDCLFSEFIPTSQYQSRSIHESPMSSGCFQNISTCSKDISMSHDNELTNDTADEDRFSRITSLNRRANESIERSRMLVAKFSNNNHSNTGLQRDNEISESHSTIPNSEERVVEINSTSTPSPRDNGHCISESDNLATSPCSKMLMLIDFDEQIVEPQPTSNQRVPTYEEIIDVTQPAEDFQATKETQYKNTIDIFMKETGQSTDRSTESHYVTELETRNTSNDINDILKVLEDEEAAEYSTHLTNSISGLNMTNKLQDNLSLLNEDVGTSRSENPGNLVELLSYLDKVDESSKAVLDLAQDSIKSVQENTARQLGIAEPFAIGDGQNELSVKLEDLLSLSVVDLAHMVFTLRFQMTDKTKSVRALKQALKEEREERQRIEYEAEKNLKSRLQEQKDHFENAVSRHQKFIDQLISDKKALTAKVENVVEEMKGLEERHAKNIKVIQERHAIEVKRAKDCQAASNKMKMDSWISTKTKKIKEQTVKGLEPELVRMTAAHQQELSELRHLHQHELKEAELRGARKTETALELLRTQMTLEKEAAIAREKDLAKIRLEKQAEQEEQSYQEQRQRLLAEGQREKLRFEQELRAAASDNARLIERLAQEHRDEIDAAARGHAADLRKMRETLNTEREQWVVELRRQKELELAEKERQCREESRIERDKQIEMVITRLTEETSQAKSELEMSANSKMRKLKEKFAADVKELEEAEHAAKVKYSKVKEQLADSEDAVSELKSCNRQLEKELHEEKKLSAAFSAERAQLKESVRDEVAGQLAAAERETTRLRAELEGSRSRFDVELRTLRDVQQHELRAVHERVKAVVAQRDATIQELRNRCTQLEALVEAQRKEYLLK